jgi:hypothetical protein
MLGTRCSGIFLFCLLIALLLLTSLPAKGSDPRASTCVAVSDDAERLQCYDSAFERVTGNDESMIDMENNNTQIGIGIALTDLI